MEIPDEATESDTDSVSYPRPRPAIPTVISLRVPGHYRQRRGTQQISGCRPRSAAYRRVLRSRHEVLVRPAAPRPGSYAEWVLGLGTIVVDGIAPALADQTDYEHRWPIDPRSGEVVFWTSDTGIAGHRRPSEPTLPLIIGTRRGPRRSGCRWPMSLRRAGSRHAKLERMQTHSADFELTMDELRAVAGYAVACAEPALVIFQKDHPDDPRPAAALQAARVFAEGAPRSRLQRATATDAHRAARDAATEAARHAANAAGDAAAAAYLHPLATATQVRHILGRPPMRPGRPSSPGATIRWSPST